MADWNGKTSVQIACHSPMVISPSRARKRSRTRLVATSWSLTLTRVGSGIMHTSVGHTTLVTPELADAALRGLLAGDHPMCIIEDEQRIVWPIQKAMQQTPT